MSKLLVVKGHPLTAEVSLSLKGLDAFVEAYKASHPADKIEVLDVFDSFIPTRDTELVSALYALGGGADFSSLSTEQQKKVTRSGELLEQFLAADKVVIANPLYNLMIPSELKAWIDTINIAGKTFKYTENGPVGLATDKKVLHLQANGGVYNLQDPAEIYMSSIFKFIGTNYSAIAVEGHSYDPSQTETLTAAFIEKVEAAAKVF